MKLKLNGEEIEVKESISLLELMKEKDFDQSKYVAVVNGDVVPRSKVSEIILKDNDTVEMVTMMGGG